MLGRVRRRAGKLAGPLLLILVLVIFCLAAEGVCRVFVPEPVSYITRMGANIQVRQDEDGRTSLYHQPYNERYSLEKALDTFRIIILGDSMTNQGPMLPEKRFAHLLEQWLNQQDDSLSYEVYRFAAGGYNIEQIEQLFYEALSFEPDLMIYNFFVNDPYLTSFQVTMDGYVDQVQTEDSVPRPLTFPGDGFFMTYSHAYRFFLRKLTAIIQKLRPGFEPESFSLHYWRSKQALDRMVKQARAEHIPFVLVVAPYLEAKEVRSHYGPDDFLLKACDSGLLILAPSERLAEHYTAEELRVSESDGHLDEFGSSAFAEALQPYFQRYVLGQSSLEHLIPSDDPNTPCKVV